MENTFNLYMRDFTLSSYSKLLDQIRTSAYEFITFQQFCERPDREQKWCILRHDVDRLPWNAVKMSDIEREKGIKASYYFRVAKEAYNQNVIKRIVEAGHEAGYHYEDMDLASGDKIKAYELFKTHLEHFRSFYDVKTICMHGSPLSQYDNRDIWKEYDYKDHGIIGEPYYDLDFNNVFYVTDTGRKWNNSEVSVRDKVKTPFNIEIQNIQHFINRLKAGELPDKIMINTHPNRWFDESYLWVKELVMQNIKNQIKKVIIKKRKNSS